MLEQEQFQQHLQRLLLLRLRGFSELLPIFPSLVWVFSLLCLVSRPFAIALNNNKLTTFENIQELK